MTGLRRQVLSGWTLEAVGQPAPDHLRKMACSFGWDWGPSTGTAGLWQPVELHTWSGGRLASLDVRATVAGDAQVSVSLDVEGAAGSVSVDVRDGTLLRDQG